jgi:hypothetical protein
MCGALSDERTGLSLKLLLALSSAHIDRSVGYIAGDLRKQSKPWIRVPSRRMTVVLYFPTLLRVLDWLLLVTCLQLGATRAGTHSLAGPVSISLLHTQTFRSTDYCCWPSPAQEFFISNPIGPVTIPHNMYCDVYC